MDNEKYPNKRSHTFYQSETKHLDNIDDHFEKIEKNSSKTTLNTLRYKDKHCHLGSDADPGRDDCSIKDEEMGSRQLKLRREHHAPPTWLL